MHGEGCLLGEGCDDSHFARAGQLASANPVNIFFENHNLLLDPKRAAPQPPPAIRKRPMAAAAASSEQPAKRVRGDNSPLRPEDLDED